MRGLNLCSSAILIGLIVLSKLDDTNAGSGGLSNKTSLNLVHNAFDGFHLGIYTHLESSTLFFNNSNTFYDPEHELTHNRRVGKRSVWVLDPEPPETTRETPRPVHKASKKAAKKSTVKKAAVKKTTVKKAGRKKATTITKRKATRKITASATTTTPDTTPTATTTTEESTTTTTQEEHTTTEKAPTKKRTTPRRHATPPTVKKPTPKVTRATDPPPPSVARTPDPPPPPVPQAPEPPSAPPALSDAPVKPTSKFMVVPDDHSTTPGEQQFRTRKQHTKVKTTNTGAIFFLIFCSITCLSFGVLAGLLIYMLILVRHRGGKLSSKGTSKSASS